MEVYKQSIMQFAVWGTVAVLVFGFVAMCIHIVFDRAGSPRRRKGRQ